MTQKYDIYIGSGFLSTDAAMLHRHVATVAQNGQTWHQWGPFMFLNLVGGRPKSTS